MKKWKKYRFSDFVDINPSLSLSRNKEYSYVEMKDLTDGIKACFPSIERKPASGSRFRENDTLFAKITPCLENGKICQVRGLKDGVGFGSTEFFVFRGKENTSTNDFVFYLSRWEEVRNFAESNFEGTSGRQRVPKTCFGNLSLQLPSYEEQIQIANILCSLDDKIDLLQRQNKTLEQLAETLFRQWFVEEAEESWEIGKLGDLVNIKYGKDHKKLGEGNIPVYGSGGIMRYADASLYNSESVLIPRKGTLNNIVYIDEPFWTVDTMFYTIMNKPNLAKFVFIFLKGQNLASMNVGSAVPSMTTEILINMPLSIPPDNILENFESATLPYYNKIKSNTNQIQTLTQLRDTLLPKLMSGEVRVNN